MNLVTESIAISQDVIISAHIENYDASAWKVTVLISRPANQTPIMQNEIDVELLNEQGFIPVITRPSDVWPEAGGAAGTTANGTFLFASGKSTPTLLKIYWAGKLANLKVLRS